VPPRRISDSAVRRLSHYLRFLDEFESAGKRTVSSEYLADRGGITSAQVRKDLSHFGSFGKRGMGYPVGELRERIASILGLGRRWRVALIGAGQLGAALFHYAGFRRQGFGIVAVLDNDPAKIGRRWGDLTVADVAELPSVVHRHGIELAIVTTPAEAAQDVVDALAGAGVEAILNFAPRKLQVPADVTLRDVNLTIELESLTFALTQKQAAQQG
jgi:redox-sensing transcriptional repressor